jgi:hypothetical protein
MHKMGEMALLKRNPPTSVPQYYHWFGSRRAKKLECEPGLQNGMEGRELGMNKMGDTKGPFGGGETQGDLDLG